MQRLSPPLAGDSVEKIQFGLVDSNLMEVLVK
jgi:hypothetical protein